MSQMSIEDEVLLENEEELNELEYFGDEEKPIFESVRVTKKDFSIYELYRKYKKKQLILEVDFQRNEVWGPKQKCELIESILMGLPLPIFYFKQQNNSTYVVVDGKQRLSTLFDFLSDGFPLKSLKILKFLNGKKFKNLVDELGIYQSQLEDYQVYSHVILPPTPDKILFDIFDRVNRGGTKLNKQEIRNALYHGRGLNMITEVVASQEFLQATRIEYKKDRRMKGSYLVTRFLAFYLFFNDLLFKDGKKYENADAQTFTENGTMYVVLTDGKNYGGSAGGTVTNIDKIKPTIEKSIGSTTTGNTGTINVSNIIDIGGSGLKGIYISKESTAPTVTSVTWIVNIQKDYITTVYSNGIYNVWVIDNAGNISNNSTCIVSGIVSKTNITEYEGITIIAGNKETPRLSYTGTPQKKYFYSSDDSIAIVDYNTGEVTGQSVGYAWITVVLIDYDGTEVTSSCQIGVKEYLLYYGDKKDSRTGGFSLYRNGTSEIYDMYWYDNRGFGCTVNDSGYEAAWVSNNAIDMSKISSLEFHYRLSNNLEKLYTYLKVGTSWNKNANNSFNFAEGVERNLPSLYVEYETIKVNVNYNYTGYLKAYFYHGTNRGYSLWGGIEYIIANP